MKGCVRGNGGGERKHVMRCEGEGNERGGGEEGSSP